MVVDHLVLETSPNTTVYQQDAFFLLHKHGSMADGLAVLVASGRVVGRSYFDARAPHGTMCAGERSTKHHDAEMQRQNEPHGTRDFAGYDSGSSTQAGTAAVPTCCFFGYRLQQSRCKRFRETCR